jgi:hypothetical protein
MPAFFVLRLAVIEDLSVEPAVRPAPRFPEMLNGGDGVAVPAPPVSTSFSAVTGAELVTEIAFCGVGSPTWTMPKSTDGVTVAAAGV